MLERTARPLRGLWNGIAGAMDAIFSALGRPGKLLQDFLNGTWLGHTLHAAIVDVVVGASTAALVLDVLRVAFGVGPPRRRGPCPQGDVLPRGRAAL